MGREEEREVMGDINQYFSRHEVACKCGCGYDSIDAETLAVITDVREHYDSSVTINSGCRCKEHNESVGGAKTSQHLYARACDIVVAGVSPEDVYTYLDNEYPTEYGIGKYSTFTHIDTRSGPRRRW